MSVESLRRPRHRRVVVIRRRGAGRAAPREPPVNDRPPPAWPRHKYTRSQSGIHRPRVSWLLCAAWSSVAATWVIAYLIFGTPEQHLAPPSSTSTCCLAPTQQDPSAVSLLRRLGRPYRVPLHCDVLSVTTSTTTTPPPPPRTAHAHETAPVRRPSASASHLCCQGLALACAADDGRDDPRARYLLLRGRISAIRRRPRGKRSLSGWTRKSAIEIASRRLASLSLTLIASLAELSGKAAVGPRQLITSLRLSGGFGSSNRTTTTTTAPLPLVVTAEPIQTLYFQTQIYSHRHRNGL
ncbi:hypothetical protein TCAP_04058 [Tolypocladium capitatum]|uniref:Uncharacterized protein n=1 Tax=Tolypocladium capitatum TaxID=45235 RepID=A0A2K3QEQ5_9HYPO|nr:hypothetical protein TCAP_04058 [Tolypocladium capitatum]